MASDPVVREAILAELRSNGSVVSGPTYGDVVEQLAPWGVSQTKAKAALNSLAYTTARPREVSIARRIVGRTATGEIVVSLLRS